jgi:stress response protein YsnF
MEPDEKVVVPVVREELTADAVLVQTGGVRVTKHVEHHNEILEQELRTGRVEVKRVKTERVVDGPQPLQRSGNTLIIPVVSEVLTVQKQWVVTEEIHLTQIEERETVRQTVPVAEEQAVVERLDERGNVIERETPNAAAAASAGAFQAPPGTTRTEPASTADDPRAAVAGRRVLSSTDSLLRDRATDPSRKR